MNSKVAEALNKQLNMELASAYTYLSMSAYLYTKSLDGCAGWMKAQAQEELVHAMKIFDYLSENDQRVILEVVDTPRKDWEHAQSVFEESLDHEKKVTQSIHELDALCDQEKDRATKVFLQWFISEQVEEEASFRAILDKFTLLKGAPECLYLINQELTKRTPIATVGRAPAPTAPN